MKNVEDRLLLVELFRRAYKYSSADVREMSNRNIEIFFMRYVYDMTYAAIGKEFNLSNERVRQIIAKTHRKMKYHIEAMNLV
jgi:DNA-directed RNA polymerase sigma subunit (sigma70/sigma32)